MKIRGGATNWAESAKCEVREADGPRAATAANSDGNCNSGSSAIGKSGGGSGCGGNDDCPGDQDTSGNRGSGDGGNGIVSGGIGCGSGGSGWGNGSGGGSSGNGEGSSGGTGSKGRGSGNGDGSGRGNNGGGGSGDGSRNTTCPYANCRSRQRIAGGADEGGRVAHRARGCCGTRSAESSARAESTASCADGVEGIGEGWSWPPTAGAGNK